MSRNLITFDWAIKRILRSKANFVILEGFLTELLALGHDVKIVNILESESNKETKDDKLNRVDLLVQIQPDELVLIEVQVSRELDFIHRMLFGTSKVVIEYIAAGEAYDKIKKIYSVNVLYFDIGSGSDYVYKGITDFIGIHNKDRLKLSDNQVAAYKKEWASEIFPEYYLIKVNNFDNLAKNTLDEWIYFFKNAEIKAEFTAKGLREANTELDVLKLSEEERKIYERYKDDLRYQASMFNSSFMEGKLEGKDEEKRKIALNMLSKQFSVSAISEIIGLSTEEIKDLIK